MTLVNGHNEFGGWIIHLQAAIEGDPLGYNAPAAKYDDAAVLYDTPASPRQWVTLDCQITRVTANHGGQLGQIPGVCASLGRLTAELYDPGRVLDPASTSFELLTRPGAGVRLVAVQPVSGAVWPLWTGVTETFTHNLKTGTGQLVASDLIALFTGVDVANWNRPNEGSHTRLNSILAVMPKPVPFSFHGTAITLAAAQFSGDLWSAVVRNTQEAEQSLIWIDQAGTLRRNETQGLGPPVRATDCEDGVTPIIYTELSSYTDDELMTNIAMVDRTNLPQDTTRAPLFHSDPASVSYYGPHSMTQTRLPLIDDAALHSWAAAVLGLRANHVQGISGMEILIVDSFPWVARSIPAIVRLSVASVLDVALTSRGESGRWVAAVAGITHNITQKEWNVSLELADGPRLTENWGYNHAQSIYDTTIYARQPGLVGPSIQQVEAALMRILAQEEVA